MLGMACGAACFAPWLPRPAKQPWRRPLTVGAWRAGDHATRRPVWRWIAAELVRAPGRLLLALPAPRPASACRNRPPSGGRRRIPRPARLAAPLLLRTDDRGRVFLSGRPDRSLRPDAHTLPHAAPRPPTERARPSAGVPEFPTR